MTTDWRVVQAVAVIVREIIGPTGTIRVMEGSGNGATRTHMDHLGYTTTNLSAVDEIIALEEEGTGFSVNANPAESAGFNQQVALPNFSYTAASPGQVGFGTPAGTFAQYFPNGNYWVNTKMYTADALISIPVLKNHTNSGVTGSVKNIGIGATPPRIYGMNSDNVQDRNAMVNHDTNDLHQWIADYFAVLPADFTVMDGLQGLQQGPIATSEQNWNTNRKNLRSILASRDALAIDIVASNIMGWDYTSVPYITILGERGQAHTKPNEQTITLRGHTRDIVVLGNRRIDDIRGSGPAGTGTNGGRWACTLSPATMPGNQISAANEATPMVSITTATFSGNDLNMALTLSANTVKIDVYIGGVYRNSFNTNMANISMDASAIANGSHNIEVRAFTNFMFSAVATTTVMK